MGAGLRRPAAKEALEHPRQLLRGDPATAVGDLQLNMVCPGALSDLYDTRESKLERVGNQVENDLLPLVTIHVDRLRSRIAVDRESDTGSLEGRAEHAGEVSRQGCEIGRLESGFGAACLDARELQERVDELEQAAATAA